MQVIVPGTGFDRRFAASDVPNLNPRNLLILDSTTGVYIANLQRKSDLQIRTMKYYYRHRVEISSALKKLRRRDPEEFRRRDKEDRSRNLKQYRERERKYRLSHREELIKRRREWRQRNIMSVRKYAREWAREHYKPQTEKELYLRRESYGADRCLERLDIRGYLAHSIHLKRTSQKIVDRVFVDPNIVKQLCSHLSLSSEQRLRLWLENEIHRRRIFGPQPPAK